MVQGLLRAQTCFNLLLMLVKLDLGVRASTFFSFMSEMFLTSLGVLVENYFF